MIEFEFHPNKDAMTIHVDKRLPNIGMSETMCEKSEGPKWFFDVLWIDGVDHACCLGGYDFSVYKGSVFEWPPIQAALNEIIKGMGIDPTEKGASSDRV